MVTDEVSQLRQRQSKRMSSNRGKMTKTVVGRPKRLDLVNKKTIACHYLLLIMQQAKAS